MAEDGPTEREVYTEAGRLLAEGLPWEAVWALTDVQRGDLAAGYAEVVKRQREDGRG